MKGERNLQDINEGRIRLEEENEEIELLWKEIRKHRQILVKMASVLEELSEELDEVKAINEWKGYLVD